MDTQTTTQINGTQLIIRSSKIRFIYSHPIKFDQSKIKVYPIYEGYRTPLFPKDENIKEFLKKPMSDDNDYSNFNFIEKKKEEMPRNIGPEEIDWAEIFKKDFPNLTQHYNVFEKNEFLKKQLPSSQTQTLFGNSQVFFLPSNEVVICNYQAQDERLIPLSKPNREYIGNPLLLSALEKAQAEFICARLVEELEIPKHYQSLVDRLYKQ